MRARAWQALVIFSPLLCAGATGSAQDLSAPVAVGVITATPRPLTETDQFLGRIEAVHRVDLVARVTAFLEKRLFTEGGEVKAGDKLYELEKGPFLADGYTDILAPIDGQIGRTSVTEGNVVGPSSGPLATIVSQDPMYVTFPVPVREALELRDRYASRGGFNAVLIRLRLSNGRLYDKTGHLNFASNTITTNTDTITVRGEITNPPRFEARGTPAPVRELVDGEFVTVFLEGVQPVQVLAVPRAAVLTDQRGSYVYVVGGDNTVEQRRIQVGQSTTTLAGIISGLQQGEHVIAEGLQKVRPGTKVAPGPASAQIQVLMTQNDGEGDGGQNGSRPGPAASNTSPVDPSSGTAGKAPANTTQAPGSGRSSPKAQSGGR